MKVRNLINALKNLPPDAEVRIRLGTLNLDKPNPNRLDVIDVWMPTGNIVAIEVE